jgi:catechol-2,3-dioxygenase
VCIWKGTLAAMDTLPFDLTAKAEIRHVHKRYCVGLDAVVAFYLRLSMAATWKMLDAVFLARGGCLHCVAFNQRPLPRPRCSW